MKNTRGVLIFVQSLELALSQAFSNEPQKMSSVYKEVDKAPAGS